MPTGQTDLSGKKFDGGKIRYDLLPRELLEGISEGLAFGAAKYGDYNWAGGIKYSRCFAALMRHLWAWWSGEECDPESGISHLSHAGCNLGFLIAFHKRGTGEDDRYRP